MTAVNLTVDVHCHRPKWVFTVNTRFQNPSYRIYINDDLLTERTWIWDNDTIIQENMWIYVDTSITHTLTIVPVCKIISQAKFKLSNFIVITQPFISEQINDHAISFTLQ